jgi:outer membrane lipoprotein-sorting protein
MLRLLPLAALSISACLAVEPLVGQSLNDTLDKLDRSAAAFKSVTADLKQTAHTAVINEDNVESGTIHIKRAKPGDTRMLVEFTKPDAKLVQLQGKALDIFLPKLNTVQEYDVGKNRALLEQFLLLGFGTTRKDLEAANDLKFGGSDTLNGKSAVRLDLTPKSADIRKQVTKIELWLSPETAYPLGHKVHQPGGDYQLFQFENLKMNPDLPDSALKLKLPKDVKKEYPGR